MPTLFDPLTIRGVTLRNRIGVSPMCQYSSEDGRLSDWHLVHLGSRAVGGAGLVICEATAVEPRGRITWQDAGLWSDSQIEPLTRINQFMKQHGAVPGIQLAHAGRKASTQQPWSATKPGAVTPHEGGWDPVAPSAVPFYENDPPPAELSRDEIAGIQSAFIAATDRAATAGFDWLELHSAHGYLMHSFLSPLSNRRTDEFGGPFENRARIVVDTARRMRDRWPSDKPMSVRISCTDWFDGGWTLEDTVKLARLLKEVGVDVIDCSSGGSTPHAKIPAGASFQVPLSETVRKEAGIATAAVGLVVEPMQADEIIRNGRADIVLLGREMLRDPYWPWHAARVLRRP